MIILAILSFILCPYSIWVIRKIVIKAEKSRDNKKRSEIEGQYILGIMGLVVISVVTGISAFAFTVAFFIQSYDNKIKISEYNAFINENIDIYRQSLDETSYILTDEQARTNVFVQGSIEKFGVGTEIANNIVTLREAITSYNLSIAEYNATKNHWWWLGIRSNLPENIKPVKILRTENVEIPSPQ